MKRACFCANKKRDLNDGMLFSTGEGREKRVLKERGVGVGVVQSMERREGRTKESAQPK